ncbi:glutamate receptor ionotropic, delta-1 [Planococcus citri]|uniref:glutamate receptor ionotropic, delta-1 n=1 Tax=Planococcus citri TaxID=170843 RepID=UPI0031F90224
MSKFIHSLLLGLCTNYPPTNDTVTEPPPWKWVPEKQMIQRDNGTFYCELRTVEEIKRKILDGKKLKVATLPDRPPMSWVVHGKNETLIGKGIAFEILDTLSRKFGFTYEISLPTRKTLINEKGSILNMLTQGDVDMIAAFIPVLPGLEHEIQWSVELSHFEYVVMMRRPKESATGSGLLAPFEYEVWLLILASLIIVGPIIHCIMKLRSKLCDGSRVYPLASCIWFVYGALMKQGSSLSPINDSTRIMFATWWIFIMILTSFYTANLTAFLTLSRFTLPIHSVEDIAKPDYRWVALEGDAIEYSVKQDNDLSVLRQSWRQGRGRFINNPDHLRIKSLIAEGVLLLHERNWLNSFMLGLEREMEIDKEHCKYVLTTRPYLTRSLSFAFPKHSILPHLFNSDMLSYVESGIIRHLLTATLPEADICPLNLGSKERQLRVSDLYTTYEIIITGFCIALSIFCIEIIGNRLKNREITANKQSKTKKSITSYRLDCLKRNNISAILKEGTPTYVNGRDYITLKNSTDNNFKMVPARGLSAFLVNRLKY